MPGKRKPDRRVYRLTPCPDWDVEGVESWLTDLAGEGLLLAEDGIWGRTAAFTRGEPRRMKYRLEAAPRSPSLWDENGGNPDPEAVELGERYGWRYVARYGEFYIYRSADPSARELNTDPAVQALALAAVEKRRRGAVFRIVAWWVLYLVLFARHGLFIGILSTGTGFALFEAFLLLWVCGDDLAAAVSLGRLRKRLQAGEGLASSKNWRRRSLRYNGIKLAQTVCILLFFGILLYRWGVSVLDEDIISIQDYPAAPPFATMADFAGEEGAGYRQTMTGARRGFNMVREWPDVLAPENLEWHEHAAITLSDGRVLDGGYYVDYHETVSPWLARRVAEEYHRKDAWEKDYEPLDIPALEADFAVAYRGRIHFPTVVIQKGNKVVHAEFYQISPNYEIPLEEWTAILADSLN